MSIAQDERSINFSKLQDTWYVKLIRMLDRGVSKSNVTQIFDSVSFIVFNYDRCIEHFLRHALQAAYGIQEQQADEICGDLHIIHPYGCLGELPLPGTPGLPFGGFDQGNNYIQFAQGIEAARRKIAEEEAELAVAKADILKFEGQLEEARSSHEQAMNELGTKQELQRRNAGIVAPREIEKLEVLVEGRMAAVAAATAAKEAAELRVTTLLPAEKASAEAALAQAQVELEKTVVRAGVSGRLEQFALRVGDVVNPLMRPAGVLIPDRGGRSLQAGFGQIEAQILKVGMTAEVTCVSKPWTIIPMVVTDVQDYIPAGQFRGGEQLIDPQQVTRPGTLLAFLEPLYKGGLDDVTPGSSCIANAYTNNHELIVSPETSMIRGLALHAVDALAIVHAMLLRIQALVLPFETLVFSGH
jgi:multidrug resistance efflux pump